jgi:hypothetical protein
MFVNQSIDLNQETSFYYITMIIKTESINKRY